MRIVIDMQGAQTESRFRGIGRYSLSLAQAMARHAGNHEIWIALNAQLPESIPDLRQAFSALIPEERIRIFDVPCSENPGQWVARAAEQIREHFVASLSPDVVLITSVFEGYRANAVTSVGACTKDHRTAAILYDLIPFLNQGQYLPTTELRDYYHRKVGWLKNSDLLLAISEHSRQEGVQHLTLSADHIVNISTAVGPQFRPRRLDHATTQVLLARLGITRKVVMYAPGGFDPRKNFDRLIEAYSLLPRWIRDTHQLVIVSRLHPPERHALLGLRKRFGLDEDELILPGYVEDDDLIALYSLADLFIFPSTHEGFGLPVLEAMACGTPVIGSNSTGIPEVIGWEEALFDPLSVASISRKMAQALTDVNFREQLLLHGSRQARNFSWDNSALRALDALENLPVHSKAQGASPKLHSDAQALIQSLAEIRSEGEPTDQELSAAARSIAFNIGGETRQMLLDISTLVHTDAKSGIQRVVRSLLRELLTSPPPHFDVRPVYFDQGIYRYANRFRKNLLGDTVDPDDSPVDFCQDDVYLSLDLNMHLTAQVHDVQVRLRTRGIQLYFIVYDILPIQRPEWWPSHIAPLFQAWLTSISEVATGLLCISNAVSEDVKDWLKSHPPERAMPGPEIRSFHLGADVQGSLPSSGLPPDATDVLTKLKCKASFLMVGTLEPRKGHAQAVQAFEMLWSNGVDANLVIVGKKGWLVDDLANRLDQHPEKGSRLFWLKEGISDEYLELVYESACCLLAPSEGEGFGLPLIEAAQHKLPIIARDIPVFREVAGEHALYFSGKTADTLANSVREWLEKRQGGIVRRSGNMPWLTWKESAQNLLDLLPSGPRY